MSRLIMFNMITLDGYFEGDKSWDLGFHDLVWGPELEQLSNEQLHSADRLVFGRVTWEGMAEYWSKATGTTADHMNRLPKVVCSRTLTSADWNHTAIVKDAVAELPELKQQGQGNMFVFGSGMLCEALMNANLFDEYRLVVVPVILGKGRRLFNAGVSELPLKLLEARPLAAGGVILQFAPLRTDGKITVLPSPRVTGRVEDSINRR